MSLLVDSCVWSLSLRRHPSTILNSDQQRLIAELHQAIAEHRASIIGVIRQEVLSGVRVKAQFQKLQQLLAPFVDEDLTAADYIDAARLYNACQDHGVQCGGIDMLICAVAARRNFTVLTYDQALLRCLKVLRIPHL